LDYSGGYFADFWCHIADVAFWALDPKGLKSIVARGEKVEGIADTPQWLEVDYEFDDLKLYWTTEPPNVPGAADRGIGAYFVGDKGSLICDYNSREITINGETMTEIPEIPQSIIRSPGHQQNFVNSVKSRSQPESNLAYARNMTLPMHLGLISYRLGRKLNWDSEKEKFIGDAEANDLLSRKARKAWRLVT
jgi:predicted dehydrogenase